MLDTLFPFELYQLQFLWFTAFVILLTGYAILDGFDLGVGILHLFSKSDKERRLMLNSIGPVWDGNEVWLITAGGALFAGFPLVYATVCSAFYTPIMMLLSAIIFRAVAIEFRSKQPMSWWRWSWDITFAVASFLIAFLLGVALGNLVRGISLDQDLNFAGSFTDHLNPYALLTGVTTVALFTMHGSIFLMLKTEGQFHEKMRVFVNPSIIFFIMCYAILTVATLLYMPHMADRVRTHPSYFALAVINMFAIANIPREISLGRDGRAFISSCVNIICLLLLFGTGMYPVIVRDLQDPNLALTVWNASSSKMTLQILLLLSLIGMPLVVGYTTMIYWIFRGKVKLTSRSY